MFNNDSKKYNLKVIIGGAEKMEAAIIRKGFSAMHSADVNVKSDWEEIADICFEAAKKKGLTKKDSCNLLKQARKTLNARNR